MSGESKQAVEKIQMMKVGDLLLDAKNPRLTSSSAGTSQTDLLRVLWSEMSVDEIALSIAANGFFKEEPLFVIPSGEADHKYIVIEGNRRLAAVMVLRDASIRKLLKASNLPSLTKEQLSKLDELPVSIYSSREELWQYYGFRHINGPKAWDAYSKAEFVATVHENQKIPLETIALHIGDQHRTVERLYRGFVVLRQAEKNSLFSRDDRVQNRFSFNFLYTAVDQPDFQRFLGIDGKNSLRPDPVPAGRQEALQELLIWLYGSKADGKAPLIRSQNPDLRILREVISKPKALSALRTWQSLDRAYEASAGDERRFIDALTKAKEYLVQAAGTVTTGYSGDDDLYEIVSDITAIVETLDQEMQKKRSKTTSR
jgi:ParB-like nuclease domain